MSDAGRTVTLAIPSVGEGGLSAQRSGHFGRCDCFTLVDIRDGAVADVRVIDNPPHQDGGCLRPVQLLHSHGASALLVAGIGGRPLAGFRDVGIEVYQDDAIPMIGDAVEAFMTGSVAPIGADGVCGGH